MEILGAGIDSTGTATVSVKITDGNGVPLDAAGLFTEGTVSLSFVLAWLDEGPAGAGQYTAYTVRPQGNELQAGADQGGTLTEIGYAEGTYRYTFASSAATADRSKTHTVGVYGSRTIDDRSYFGDATFDFVPNGAAVTVRRQVVTDQACNSCHDQLALHGGSRRSVALCILCHQPQSVDPDTGNTVDFRVMVHKIHRGASLPSVIAGTPYQILGFRPPAHDYSTVVFPQDIRNCAKCHDGPDAAFGVNRPSRAVCGSCHDNVSFVLPTPPNMLAHPGGPLADDNSCRVCHPASGGIAGISDRHVTDAASPANPQLAVELQSIRDTAPGRSPTLRFRVTANGQARNVLTTPLTAMRVTVAGPNTDFASDWQAIVQGTGALGTLTSVNAADGVFDYTFPAAAQIPPSARGSYTVGVEAYQQASPTEPRFAAIAPTLAFRVTGTATVARRTVIDPAKCNTCHADLSFHGGTRRGAGYCSMCHNANNVNDERMSRVEDATVLVHSVDLKLMIHRIHMGEELTNPFVLGGFPAPTRAEPEGTIENFKETRYPGDRSNCNHCHAGDSWQLPLATDLLPTHEEIRTCNEDPAADTDQYCDAWVVQSSIPVSPTSAACIGCHDADHVVAHAELNVTASGREACATCHGPGQIGDVARVHRIR